MTVPLAVSTRGTIRRSGLLTESLMSSRRLNAVAAAAGDLTTGWVIGTAPGYVEGQRYGEQSHRDDGQAMAAQFCGASIARSIDSISEREPAPSRRRIRAT